MAEIANLSGQIRSRVRGRNLTKSAVQETHDDRPVRRVQGTCRVPSRQQGAPRDGGRAVRRPRRGHQHHAPPADEHGRRSDPPGPQPLGRRHRHRGASGRRARHRDQLVPGRPRRVLQVRGGSAARAWRRAHPGVRRRGRRDRAGGDSRAPRPRGGAHLHPRGRPAHGLAGNDRRDADALRPRSVDAGTGEPGGHPRSRRSGLARAVAAHLRVGERPGRRRAGRTAARERPRRAHAGHRHHRHRRGRQVEPDRRADPPHPPRSGRCLAHRGDQHRPVAAQERRRAARRPHPHERHRPVAAGAARLHAQPRHARCRQRDQHGAARRAGRLQGRRVRSGDRRDLGHRPGRRGHRAAGRYSGLRDDARVRRREPAREDRHARLRRVRRHQQVRPQGRPRRAARRGQAGAAQPPGLRQAARRDAGLRHHGQPLQRRRRHRAVPGAESAAGRGWASA